MGIFIWEYHIYIIYLLGGLEHEWTMTFHSVGNFMIPIDELFIFFRGVGRYTTNQ